MLLNKILIARFICVVWLAISVAGCKKQQTGFTGTQPAIYVGHGISFDEVIAVDQRNRKFRHLIVVTNTIVLDENGKCLEQGGFLNCHEFTQIVDTHSLLLQSSGKVFAQYRLIVNRGYPFEFLKLTPNDNYYLRRTPASLGLTNFMNYGSEEIVESVKRVRSAPKQ